MIWPALQTSCQGKKSAPVSSKSGVQALQSAEFRSVEGSLVSWLENPCHNGNLCSLLVQDIKRKCPYL